MRKTLCLFLALFVLAMLPATAQFHRNTGPAVWTWPRPVEAKSAENQKAFKDATAWLSRHGYPGGHALAFYQYDPVPVPGGDNPPNWPYVIFCKDWSGTQPVMQFGRETWEEWLKISDRCQVSDFSLFIKSPPVALTELENRFQFGDPTVLVPYPDPQPSQPPAPPIPAPKPATPVGSEFAPGKHYALDSSVKEFADERGRFVLRTRETPFGIQAWFEKVQ